MTYTLSGSIAKSSLSRLGSLFVAAGTITALTGCSALQSQNSPDVIYSTTAVEARALQVPPDLRHPGCRCHSQHIAASI